MIILDKKPLTLAESKELVPELEENKILEEYFKKFENLSKDKAAELTQELRDLNNPKFKEDTIVKVADFLPKDAADVNKIFTDVSLTEDETNKIVEVVGKY